MHRRVCTITLLCLATSGCATTKTAIQKPSAASQELIDAEARGCDQQNWFHVRYCVAQSILADLHNDVTTTAQHAKAAGAPSSVTLSYGDLRSRYNNFLTYYSSCLNTDTCSRGTLKQMQESVGTTYRDFITATNNASSTVAQDPATATVIIGLLTQLWSLGVDVHDKLKSEESGESAEAKADRDRLTSQLKSDLTLKNWDQI